MTIWYQKEKEIKTKTQKNQANQNPQKEKRENKTNKNIFKVPTKTSMEIQSKMSSSTTVSLKTLLDYDA